MPWQAVVILGCSISLVALAFGDDWRVMVALILGVALLGWIVQRRNATRR